MLSLTSLTSSGDTLQITVRMHSTLRHRDGKIVNQLELELPQGSRVADVLRQLNIHENSDVISALNGKAVKVDAILADGDLLQFIPAVSGG